MTEDKAEKYKRYGWTCSETNLATLPSSAPQAARDLAKWLTLEGRRSSLEEWLGHVQHDSRIHGKFWHIGSWTHRMSHSKPNQANIPSPFHGDPKSPIEEIKAKYDKHMRGHWQATPGAWLVGTDAEGIQLRVLAHLMGDEDYIKAVAFGDKSLKTDIHNVNMRALGSVCRDRDTAKTFIYAWLLGASSGKVADILSCNSKEASTAVSRFLSSLPKLKYLKDVVIPRDAKRGYFVGLDGRRVKCDSEHHMLAGYLQNGEAVVMKHANVLWKKHFVELGVWGKTVRQVDFVHDEWQTEVVGSKEFAEEVGRIQRWAIEETGRALGLKCPLAGSTEVGHSWAETH